MEQFGFLGVSASRAFEKIIDVAEIPEGINTLALINIAEKTADALENHVESENPIVLIKVMLILAKLYSFKNITRNHLRALEYAGKALGLAQEKQMPQEEFNAIVFTAKTHIYLGELEKAAALLKKVYEKNGVSEDWPIVVYLLATTLRNSNTNDLDKLYSWYRKIVDTVEHHKRIDIALLSAIDMSKYCSQSSSLDDILGVLSTITDMLTQNNEVVRKHPFFSIQVFVHCALAHEKKNDLESYKNQLQKAVQICKEYGFDNHPIFNSINNRLIFIAEQSRDTTLFEELVMITSQESTILYGFDDLFEICPLCRKPLGTAEIVSCASCASMYHNNCLLNLGLHICPNCKSRLNLLLME